MNRAKRRKSKRSAKRAESRKPAPRRDPPEVLHALQTAAQFHRAGNLQGAAAIYQQVLARCPEHPDALHLLGLALHQAGQHAQAVELIDRAIAVDGKQAHYHCNLADALRDLGRYTEAERSCRRALKLKPDYLEAYNNLGNALRDQGQSEAALEAYEQALALYPDHADVLANRADLLEMTNQVEAAWTAATEALVRAPGHLLLNVIAAKCERRRGDLEAAVARLAALDDVRGVPTHEVRVHFELGRLYDRVAAADKAIINLTRGNEILARLGGTKGEDDRRARLLSIAVLTERFTPDWVETWSPPVESDAGESPVFLVGFPRSGTTLLDQILDSHPGLQTVEERPLLLSLIQALHVSGRAEPNALASLTASDIDALRRVYWAKAGDCLERTPGTLLVDKYPLNILYLGLIYRVFPRAKVIVALRHPCDVVLSCFMQDFRMNDFMAHFTSFDSSAAFYAATMGLWQRYQSALPLDAHQIRYEDLVGDFDDAARRVLDFLGVGWDARVRDFAGHAAARGWIDTPSYADVTQPIFNRAVGRWQRYAGHLAPQFDRLRPFVEAFGYDPEALDAARRAAVSETDGEAQRAAG